MFIPINLIAMTALMVFNSNIHIPCLPSIRDTFGSNNFILLFAFTLNPLVAIFANFIFGFLSECYNKKYLLMTALGCFLTGSILCFCASSIGIFLLGRLLQAIGDGGISILGMAILSILSREQFAYYLGLSSALMAVAWGTGPLIGTVILNLAGWQWNFLIIFLLVLIEAILLIIYLPNQALEAKNQQLPSISSMWLSTTALLKNRRFAASNWGAAIVIGTFTAFEINSPLIFMDTYNFTPAKFAWLNALVITINGLGSLVYLKIIDSFNMTTALIIGSSAYIIHILGAILILSHLLPAAAFLVVASAGFLAFSLPFIASTTTIYALKDAKDHQGLALTILSSSRNVTSSTITLMVSTFYTGNIYPFFTISFICASIALRLLFSTFTANNIKP